MSNQLREVHAVLRGGRASAIDYTSPSDVSYQIALLLTIILSIAALMATSQSKTLQDIERTQRSWSESEQKNIANLRREQLLRKIRAALDAKQTAWRLAEYPSARSVQVRHGFPTDDGFKTMCAEAIPFLREDPEEAAKKLYEDALRTGEPKFFDPVVFSKDGAGASVLAVLGNSREDCSLREDALQLVRGCCDSWRGTICKVQTDLLLQYLASPDSRIHDHFQKSQTKDNLQQHFTSKGYPLLDDVFSPLAPSANGTKSP